MRLRPERFEMIEGETNKVSLDLAPLAGPNSLQSLSLDASGLTFANTSTSGNSGTTYVSGGDAGSDYIVTITAALSSGETKVGAVVFEWKAPGYDFRTGR